MFCATCHAPDTTASIHSHSTTGSTRFEYTTECLACHDQHGWAIANVEGTDNIKYVKARVTEQITVIDNTSGGATITKTVDNDVVYTGPGDFANGDTLYDRDGFAPSGGQPITGPHAVFGDPDCGSCHDSTFFPGAADNPAGLPSVFCATCHAPDTTASIHSHSVSGSTRFDYTVECLVCHDQHGWELTNVDGTDNIKYVRATIDSLITVIDNTQTPPVEIDKSINSSVVFDSLDDFADGDPNYGRDICVTCHTLTNHHQNDGDAPGGQSHFDGAACTSCHSHPEGFRPPGGLAGPPVQGPHSAVPGFAPGDCMVCHNLYPTVEEMQVNSTAVCLACHSDGWTVVSATPEHVHSSAVTGSTSYEYGVECTACHGPHGWAAEVENIRATDNIKYVRANVDEVITVVDNTVDPPATVIKDIDHNVVFTARSGPESFADGDGNYTADICNTCHTLTRHHQNDGDAPGGQSHEDGETCTNCHLHGDGFPGFGGPHPQADTDCSNCHLGTDGEPDLTGIHGNDCERCHTTGFSSTLLGPVGTWNRQCGDCHNPQVAETGNQDEYTRGHRCIACHGRQLGTSSSERIHKEHAKSANCVVCHGFIPDAGVRIGSGDRNVCRLCHAGGKNGSIRSIHKRHTKDGVSCLECHNGQRPAVDVVHGPPVGNATVVCVLCHGDKSGGNQKIHEKHTEDKIDCGSCHADAVLQDDRAPMPPIDDARRSMLDRGNNPCRLCHGYESSSSTRVHKEHVADQWQWCYNCHRPDDGRPAGDQPPITSPAASCALCHNDETYRDNLPFDIHKRHAGENKCYACHQTRPDLTEWPNTWLGGVEP